MDMANLHWYWFSAGALLIALEAFAPGAVLIWFGISAVLTGAVCMTTDWSLDAQLIFFSVVAVSCTVVFKYWQKRNPAQAQAKDAASSLNQPGQNMIGRTMELVTELKDGSGRVKAADSSWRCTGPDLARGTHVVVVAVQAGTLVVEAKT